jgi:hypothetical protein
MYIGPYLFVAKKATESRIEIQLLFLLDEAGGHGSGAVRDEDSGEMPPYLHFRAWNEEQPQYGT